MIRWEGGLQLPSRIGAWMACESRSGSYTSAADPVARWLGRQARGSAGLRWRARPGGALTVQVELPLSLSTHGTTVIDIGELNFAGGLAGHILSL